MSLKKFTVTYADFASSNSKVLLSKLADFAICGINYNVTEQFVTANGSPGAYISLGSDSDNMYNLCANNSADLSQLYDHFNPSSPDVNIYSNAPIDIIAYLYINEESTTGADLIAGSIEISIIIADYEA